MKKDTKFLRRGNPIAWGLALSAGIVALFLFLAIRCGTDGVSGFQEFLNSPPNAMGDTLAGFAGSLAFIWIVVTVWLQSSELAEQREQLRLQTTEFEKTNDALAAQRFDQAFFGLLSAYSEIVGGLKMDDSQGKKTGRDCFIGFNLALRKQSGGEFKTILERTHGQISETYDTFWQKHQTQLGHYFRFLYNAFRFISENPEFAKPHHARLLRSQLSDQELQLLFYNCLSKYGQKFQTYAEKFALFDNLPRELLFHASDADFMPRGAWGENLPIKATP
jgi:hypothetical protein